jgi:hypothetical protein
MKRLSAFIHFVKKKIKIKIQFYCLIWSGSFAAGKFIDRCFMFIENLLLYKFSMAVISPLLFKFLSPPLGRPRRRWVDNIKMDLREIGGEDMVWIDLAEDRDQWNALVNTVMNLRVP